MPKDSMYPGLEEDEASPSMEGEHDESKPHKDKDEEGETALLPKSFFEGQEIKPGDQFYIEIVREYENEIEVRYPHKEDKSEEEQTPESKIEAMGNSPRMGGGY